MANIRAYAQLVEKARSQHLPEAYETDLYCVDRALLEEDTAPRIFGWILRESGTHIIIDRKSARGFRTYYEATCNRKEAMSDQFYWYGGDNLLHCTPQELWEFCERLPAQPSRPTAAFHNRVEQLHIQEAARLGTVRKQLSFALTRRDGGLDYEHYNFPIIRGIDYNL